MSQTYFNAAGSDVLYTSLIMKTTGARVVGEREDGAPAKDARTNHSLRATIDIMTAWHGSGALTFANHKVATTHGSAQKEWVQIASILLRQANT